MIAIDLNKQKSLEKKDYNGRNDGRNFSGSTNKIPYKNKW